MLGFFLEVSATEQRSVFGIVLLEDNEGSRFFLFRFYFSPISHSITKIFYVNHFSVFNKLIRQFWNEVMFFQCSFSVTDFISHLLQNFVNLFLTFFVRFLWCDFIELVNHETVTAVPAYVFG